MSSITNAEARAAAVKQTLSQLVERYRALPSDAGVPASLTLEIMTLCYLDTFSPHEQPVTDGRKYADIIGPIPSFVDVYSQSAPIGSAEEALLLKETEDIHCMTQPVLDGLVHLWRSHLSMLRASKASGTAAGTTRTAIADTIPADDHLEESVRDRVTRANIAFVARIDRGGPAFQNIVSFINRLLSAVAP